MKRFLKITVYMMLLLVVNACKVNLKPFERIYVDDPQMQMHVNKDVSFQQYVYSIREGSVMTQAEKGNGGCGCN